MSYDVVLWRNRKATALSVLGFVTGYAITRYLTNEVRRFRAQIILCSHFDIWDCDDLH